METSKYVEMLISDANMLCSEFGRPDRWAECFCLAMLKEMLNEYRPNRWYIDIPCEKERLLCLLQNTVNVKSYTKFLVEYENLIKASNISDRELYDLIIKDATEICQKRDQRRVSADIMLVSTLSRLDDNFKVGFVKDACIIAKDKINDYDNTQDAEPRAYPLQRLRMMEIGIYPVPPFCDEDALRKQVITSIQFCRLHDRVNITLPIFLRGTDEALTISAFEIDGRIILSDNGNAYRSMCSLGGEDNIEQLKLLSVSQHEFVPREDRELRCVVKDMRGFNQFVRTVCIASFLDIFTVDADEAERYLRYATTDEYFGQSICPENLEKIITESVKASYDKNHGTLLGIRYYFNDESCPMSFKLTKTSDDEAVITEFGDFDGGRLYSRIMYLNSDENRAKAYIEEMQKHFNFNAVGGAVKMNFKLEDFFSVPVAVFEYVYLASVLSELGGLLS